MAVEVGKRYYFMTHAYHHFLGEVGEIIGRNEVPLVQRKHGVIRVQSCTRGWTEFFRDGIRLNGTVFTWWPDGTIVQGWFVVAPWIHAIPLSPEVQRERSR